MVAIPVQKVSNGMKIEMRDDVWSIVEFQHIKPGKGGAFVRMKVKSLTTGRVLEETLQASERIEQADVSYRRMSFLYRDADDFVLMDNDTYDQIHVGPELIPEEKSRFLMENMEVSVVFWGEKVVAVELPTKVQMKVVETMDADRGNTATNVTKDATLESGYVAQVPLFVNRGDTVIIDTRDGSYESRA